MGISVSVALCTRNGAAFVEQQLLSILMQDRPPEEIVISDDASTDDTLRIVGRVAQLHAATSFTVLTNPVALGVTANFESAIRACAGDLIVLSDQDDVWHGDRLSRIVPEFEKRPDLALTFTDARLVDANSDSLGLSLFDALEISEEELTEIHAGRAFRLLIKRNLATGATVAFRRAILEATLPIPEPWLHDEWLAIMASSIGCVDVVEEKLIDYRQHESNEIGVRRATLLRKIRKIFEPRRDRNEQLARRFSALVVRLEELGPVARSSDLTLARNKSTLESERATLPRARMRRLRRVLEYNRKGWYTAYSSQGRLDMIRDLLQPH